MAENQRVCVTGANGFQASWLVKLLLSKGYLVHGTVRNPSDEKNDHLKKLEKASENLQLFKANLIDYDALYNAIQGCSGVFHVASPLPIERISNPEVEVIEPAVKGTLNVLKACSVAKVKKVVVVSSVGAVMLNPNWTKDLVLDESCWSDKKFCKENESWYCLSKTEAESQAWEHAKESGLNVVTVCPTFIAGPMLQSNINASSLRLIRLIKDGLETTDSSYFPSYVDVRDVAEALVLVYEKPEAEGRYICASYTLTLQDLVDKMKSMYPNYNYVKQIDEFAHPKMSSEKLKKLGWKYRPLEESIVDLIKDYQDKGILAEVEPSPSYFSGSCRH